MSSRTRTAPTTTPPAGDPTQQPTEPAAATGAECNVGECTRTATTRGLCDAHWASRRGDADPKTTTEDRDE